MSESNLKRWSSRSIEAFWLDNIDTFNKVGDVYTFSRDGYRFKKVGEYIYLYQEFMGHRSLICRVEVRDGKVLMYISEDSKTEVKRIHADLVKYLDTVKVIN